MMRHIHSKTFRYLQTATFAVGLLLSAPLAGMEGSAEYIHPTTQKSDIEIVLTDKNATTVVFKT